MRLMILREEATGLFGGVRFQLRVKCELTHYERDLIEKYKAHKEVLAQKEIPIPLTGRAFVLNLKIGDLVEGQIFKCADVPEILAYERALRKSCKKFQNYLQAMAAFGGQENIDFGEVIHPALEIHKTLTLLSLDAKQGVERQVEITRWRAGRNEQRVLTVSIPPNTKSGQTLRMVNEGNESHSGHGFSDVLIEILVMLEPERPVATDERQCPKCGKIIKDNATTCMYCWTKLGGR